MPNLIREEDLKCFKKNGLICVRGLIPKTIVEKLKLELEKLISSEFNLIKNSHLNSVTIFEGEINSIHCLKEMANYNFEELFAQTNLQSVATSLLESHAYCHISESFLKPPRVGKKIFPHQDDEYYCLKEKKGFNVVIALDQATRENGAIYYYMGSHQLGPIPHKTLGLKTYTVEEDQLKEFEKFYQEVEPGDCIFHHPLIIHGSEENTSALPRKTITRLYSPFPDGLDSGRARLRMKKAFAELSSKDSLKKVDTQKAIKQEQRQERQKLVPK